MKLISITYSECVFAALGILHAHILMFEPSGSDIFTALIQYLKTLRFSEEKNISNTKCVFWFSLQILSETFLILRRTERDIIKNVYWSSCEVPAIIVRI